MRFFTLSELCKSETASKIGLTNVPDGSVKKNLVYLVDNLLDPLREAYGKPIRINSAYRSPTVNAMVGGSKNSHHILGMAADITGGNAKENKILFDLVQKLKLPFTQLIDEKGFRWVHVSLDPNNVKKQILHLK